jgi:hypothetical protein
VPCVFAHMDSCCPKAVLFLDVFGSIDNGAERVLNFLVEHRLYVSISHRPRPFNDRVGVAHWFALQCLRWSTPPCDVNLIAVCVYVGRLSLSVRYENSQGKTADDASLKIVSHTQDLFNNPACPYAPFLPRLETTHSYHTMQFHLWTVYNRERGPIQRKRVLVLEIGSRGRMASPAARFPNNGARCLHRHRGRRC